MLLLLTVYNTNQWTTLSWRGHGSEWGAPDTTVIIYCQMLYCTMTTVCNHQWHVSHVNSPHTTGPNQIHTLCVVPKWVFICGGVLVIIVTLNTPNVWDVREAHRLLWKNLYKSVFLCACVWMSQCVSVSLCDWGLVFSRYSLHDVTVMICTLMSIYWKTINEHKKKIVFVLSIGITGTFTHTNTYTKTHTPTTHKINFVLSQTKRHVWMSVIFYMNMAPGDLLLPLSVILIFH